MAGEYFKAPNRRRPNPDVYEDPEYDWKKHDPGLADDLAEEIFDTEKQAQPTNAPDAAERDKLAHQEAVFLMGLPEAVTDQLKGQGIRATGADKNGLGTGYVVHCKDQQGRPFDASITFDEMIAFGQRFGASMGQQIIQKLCREIMAERARYFARMQ